MEIIVAFIGQLIGEFIFGFIFIFIYKLIIQPFLIVLGCIYFLIKKIIFKTELQAFNQLTANDLTKIGGDLIRDSLVMIILIFIVSIIVIFAFYLIKN